MFKKLPTVLPIALVSLLFASKLSAQETAAPRPEPAPITDPRPLSFRLIEWEYGAETSWQRWWALERERFLDLRRLARRGESNTESQLIGNVWASRVEDVDAPTRAQKEYLIRPGLERLRLGLSDRDAQSEVLIALGRVGLFGDESTQILREYLRAPSRDLAQSAVLALGLLGQDAAWAPLRSMLTDDANGRWLTGDGGGVQTETRNWAAIATGLGATHWKEELRLEAETTLLELIAQADARPEFQASAVIALGMIPASDAEARVDALVGLLHDEGINQSVRAMVPAAMARAAVGDATATQIVRAELLNMLTSSKAATTRQSAIRALALVPEAGKEAEGIAVATLSKLLQSARTPTERAFASLSLAEIACQAEDIKLIEATAESLVAQLKDSAPEQRGWAAVSLGVLGFEQPLWGGISKVRAERALLSRLIESKAEEERGAAAIALGLLGQQNAAPTLIRILEDGDHPSLRGHAAVALGLLGHNDAEEALLEQLANSSHRAILLEQTTIGLALIKSDSLHGKLLHMLAPENGALPTLSEVTAAARGLALIGDARTAPFLLTAMDDDHLTAKSRALAARALGYLADHDTTPWQLRMTPGLNHLAVPSSVLDWESGNGVLNRR
jgi:HEAT repeat protein